MARLKLSSEAVTNAPKPAANASAGDQERRTALRQEFKAFRNSIGRPWDDYCTGALEWWTVNQSNFPHVAKLACHYLPMPAASEVVFSALGFQMPKTATAKLPEHGLPPGQHRTAYTTKR